MAKLFKIKRNRNSYTSSRYLLNGISGLCKLFLAPVERNRKECLQQAKIAKLVQDHAIGEITLAHKANAVLLQDLQIEIKKLEIIALKHKLGDPDSPFAPIID